MADPKVRVRFTAKDETGPAVKGLRGALAGLKGLAAGVGAAIAGIGLSRFFLSSVEAAAEAQASWTRLDSAVTKAGRNFAAVRPELERLGKAFQATTRFDDEGFADSLGTLITLTNDYATSLAAVPVAADLAIAFFKGDLQTATLALGKALTGNTQTLQRYGIAIDKTGDVLEQLAVQTRGYAERDGKTLAGTLERIRHGWTDVKEAIGEAITGGDRATETMGGLVGRLADLEKWIKENREGVEGFVNLILDLAAAFLGVAAALGKMARWLNDSAVGRFFNGVFGLKQGNPFRGVEGGSNSAEGTPGAVQLGGISVVARTPEQIAADKKAADERRKRLGGVIEDARLSTFPQDLDAARTQDRFDQRGVRTGGIEAAGAPLGEALSGLTDQDVWAEVLQPWDTLLDKIRTTEQELAYLGAVTLLQFADAWTASFEAIGAGGNVIEEAGKFVKNMLADVARTKAQMEVAEGVAALAAGTFPPNPAALQAAGKHFAAAALFSLVAGAIGGRGGSRGGGAGGGAVSGNDAIRDQRDLQAARGTTTVILRKGYINTRDPDFQDFLADAITNAAGRRVEIVVE